MLTQAELEEIERGAFLYDSFDSDSVLKLLATAKELRELLDECAECLETESVGRELQARIEEALK